MEHVGYVINCIWLFPKIVVYPKNGWFIMENPIKMDNLEGKLTIFGNIHITISTWDLELLSCPRHPWLPDWRCIAGVARKNPGGMGKVKVNQQLKIPSPIFEPKRYIKGIDLHGMNHGIIDDMIPSQIAGKRHIPTIFGQKQRACWCVVLIPMQGGPLLVRNGVELYYNIHKSPYI